MAEVPTRICELVETFDRHIEAYRSSQYNETQLRREFIDPFFEELGWDVTNKAGYAQAYKDVIHEDAIKIGSATKAPDYCFRIGGSRKFFLEAKKPSVDIKGDPHPAYQLRRYAWSAKLPLSILTDFEEFAVYDCQIRPRQTDKADAARIMLLTYKDYLKKFSEISDIFSKEAILKGSFDKFAAATKGKRGTSTVDREFLAEIENWRNMLARIIALRNGSLSVREINFCVQRTIDRILFLRMCEDRGIEPYGQLQSISSGERTYPRLCEVFEKADQKYNSGLFHFHDEPDRAEGPDELTPNIIIDDKDLKWILHSLYYPQSPYEFSVLPAEILGNVYEQFLGKVITLSSAHRASVEDKPEVKKAGGVYYTPSYIVDYIVKNTVGKLCEEKTPRQIANLKILDPACGSGSFLIGAYQYLLDWHLKYYTENKPEKHKKGRNPKIFETISHVSEYAEESQTPHYGLTITEKKRILLNNIYGVDIDSQAVEVTKLSLLLKVLEGESSETIDNQYRLFHERALPDLANNIKCGNSLIGPDFYENLDPETITEELQQKINAFDWHAEFPEIFSDKNPCFDAVIGNPPYVRIQTMRDTAPQTIDYYKGRYDTASKGNYDIYVLFVECGLHLLNDKGRLGFILPHKFFNAQYGQSLRQLLSNGHHLAHVVNFTDKQVFYGATTYTCLMFLTKSPTELVDYVKVDDLDAWRTANDAQQASVPADRFTLAEWNITIGASRTLFDRLTKMSVRLGDVANKIFQGLVTSADAVFLLDPVSPERNQYVRVRSNATGKEYDLETQVVRPLCKGSLDVRRYTAFPSKRVLFPYDIKTSTETGRGILIPPETFQKEYPNTWSYLLENSQLLRERERGKMCNEKWYGYVYPKSIALFGRPKILTPSIAARASYAYDGSGEMYFVGSGGGGGGGYGIILRESCHLDLRYVLGLLNASVVDFVLKQIASTFRGGYYAYSRQYIEQLPIRVINFEDQSDVTRHDKMVELVERMLDLHKQLGAAKIPDEKTRTQRQIDATDKQIDKLVYDLYGLTEEEIKIVEGRKTND